MDQIKFQDHVQMFNTACSIFNELKKHTFTGSRIEIVADYLKELAHAELDVTEPSIIVPPSVN